jgi:hypothetical protein
MGFISNVFEDIESFLVNTLSEKKLLYIHNQEQKLLALQSSLEYRKTDMVYLVKNGYEYDKKHDVWYKEENINYGRYPGRYLFSIYFPDDYPTKPPRMLAEPLDKQKTSHHVGGGGSLCITNVEGGLPDKYWKKYMNAKGALLLAHHLVTDEIHAPKMKVENVKRDTLPIKGTVLKEIKKKISKDDFVNFFLLPNKVDVDTSYSWEEIAYVTSHSTKEVKSGMIKFLEVNSTSSKIKQNLVEEDEDDDEEEDD